MPPASGPRHILLQRFQTHSWAFREDHCWQCRVQPGLTSRTLPSGSSCPDSSSLRKVFRPWLASWILSSPFNEFNSQTVFLKSSLRLTYLLEVLFSSINKHSYFCISLSSTVKESATFHWELTLKSEMQSRGHQDDLVGCIICSSAGNSQADASNRASSRLPFWFSRVSLSIGACPLLFRFDFPLRI